MTKDLKTLIYEALDSLPDEDNHEFMLYFEPSREWFGGKYQAYWYVEMVNTCLHVSLGEVPGEYQSGRHATPEDAVLDIIRIINEAEKKP